MEVKRDAFINQSTGSSVPCMFLNTGIDMAVNKTEILTLIHLYSREKMNKGRDEEKSKHRKA